MFCMGISHNKELPFGIYDKILRYKQVSGHTIPKMHLQARIQRGGGPGVRTPPSDLSEVGSCVETSWVGEGVQWLFLPYCYQFFLARFARQYHTNILHIYILQSSMFSMERSSFLYISLIQIMKRIQLFTPCFD